MENFALPWKGCVRAIVPRVFPTGPRVSRSDTIGLPVAIPPKAEGWLSGLRRTLGKRVGVYTPRRFKSCPFRFGWEKACGELEHLYFSIVLWYVSGQMRRSYNSKEEMVARMDKIHKEIVTLAKNRSRTPEEDNRYRELSLEFTTLDTNLKAREGQRDFDR